MIAEVTNTYGDRHSYLCHRDDRAPITREDTITAQKIFHVSPFQPVAGTYTFRFDIRPDRIGIWIDYTTPGGGLFTNLIGPRQPLTNRGILASALRRPGSRRVLALIHWQALEALAQEGQVQPPPHAPGRRHLALMRHAFAFHLSANILAGGRPSRLRALRAQRRDSACAARRSFSQPPGPMSHRLPLAGRSLPP